MLPKLLQATLIHIIQHTRSTSRDFPSFFQTVRLSLAVGFGLAVHEIVIVGFAAGADEEGGGEERSGRGADFLDFGDGVGEGCCVDEDLLVEASTYC